MTLKRLFFSERAFPCTSVSEDPYGIDILMDTLSIWHRKNMENIRSDAVGDGPNHPQSMDEKKQL